MKKLSKLFVVFFIGVSIFGTSIQPASADSEDHPVVGIHVANKVDVALAVGPTTVDYSNFEQDIRAVLATKEHPIPEEDLNITATQSVSANTSSEFSWWSYDHGISAKIDNVLGQYIEATGTQTAGHPYTNYERHMDLSNNGSTMDFYGYGTNAYKDFQYLPNDQATKKTFEFSIQEMEAYDALDGVGFLFNTSIKGTYGNGQTMSGYLLFLSYNSSGQGQQIRLYQFTNVDTKNLHTLTTTANNLIENYGGTASPYFKLLGTVPYSSAHNYRSIKIKVEPTQLNLWYKGGTESDDSPLTNDDLATWTMTALGGGGATTSPTLNWPESFGFGPLVSYRSHSCSRPTHVKLLNLSMTAEKVRTLPEVIREPNWQENTLKFLVNLNEEKIEDFSSTSITAELLARLNIDDIYYIGWCSDINAQESLSFLQKHNLKGTVVNIQEEKTDNYNKQIEAIAEEIYKRYWKKNETTVVLVSDNVYMDVTGASKTDTTDPEWPQGKWKIIHRPTNEIGWDSGNEGNHPNSGKYMSDLDFQFNIPGEYDIYYCNKLINTITAHRAPVSDFTVDLTDPENPIFVDISYDPDDLSLEGIVSAKYTWMDINDPDTMVPSEGLPDSIIDDHIYLITLTTTDKLGATSSISRQISISSNNEDSDKNPPFAYFTITPSIIMKNVGTQEISIKNQSYDLYGETITSRYSVTRDGEPYTNFMLSTEEEINVTRKIDVSNLPVGEYKISLCVDSKNGESKTFIQTFNIIEDVDPPTAKANPSSETFNTNSSVNLSFSDQGGSGFKRQRVMVNESPNFPSNDEGGWTSYSESTERSVSINQVGDNYIHWEAWDNAGNRAYGSFGKYTLMKSPVTIVLTAEPSGTQTYGNEVTLTAILTTEGENTYDVGSRIYLYDGSNLLGSSLIKKEGSIVSSTFAFVPLTVGTSVFEARFLGDSTHSDASTTLNYDILKNDSASVVMKDQEDKIFDGLNYEPSNVTVTGASNYKIEYTGINGTVYGPSETPPINVGNYTIITTTTDPNYVQKSDSKEFSILPRQLVLDLQTSVNSKEIEVGENLVLSAFISNSVLNQSPKGTISFYADGVPLATGIDIINDETATYVWTNAPAGIHNISAKYIPSDNDNYTMIEDAKINNFEISKLNQTNFSFFGEEINNEKINKTYGDVAFNIVANGGESGGRITYTLVSGNGVVSFDPSSQTINILSSGTAYIKATKAGDDTYNEISTFLTINVEKAPNTLEIDMTNIHLGENIYPSLTKNASNGVITYRYEGRDGTNYGPSSTPPNFVGKFSLAAVSGETINYLSETTVVNFEILPCTCFISNIVFENGTIIIDYDQFQKTQQLLSKIEFLNCGYHTEEFTIKYEILGSSLGEGIAKIHQNTGLTVNANAVGKQIAVKVTIVHLPTGESETKIAYFAVEKEQSKSQEEDILENTPPTKTTRQSSLETTKETNISTGDSSNVPLLLLLFVGGGVILIMVLKKKLNDNK